MTFVSGKTYTLTAQNLGAVTLKNLQDVTVLGGQFSSVTLIGCRNIVFKGATVKLVPTATTTYNAQAVRVVDSNEVTFTACNVSGGLAVNGVPKSTKPKPLGPGLDATGNVLGLPCGQGFYFFNCDNFEVSDCRINHFHKAIVLGGGRGGRILRNEMCNLRSSGVVGSCEGDIEISDNHIHTSTPWAYGGNGDHGDRIHLWTVGAPMPNVTVSRNVLEQGKGAPMMCLYLDDNGKGLGFPNAVLSGNVVKDSVGQAVLLENVSGSVSNTKLTWTGSGTIKSNSPRIDIAAACHDLTVTGTPLAQVSVRPTANVATIRVVP